MDYSHTRKHRHTWTYVRSPTFKCDRESEGTSGSTMTLVVEDFTQKKKKKKMVYSDTLELRNPLTEG